MFIMKKIFIFILSVLCLWLSINQCFWYDVLIHDSQGVVIDVISVPDWETAEITLDWDWTKNWDHYSFNNWYSSTKVYYTDLYWNETNVTLNSDIYFNWEYSLWYTWINQYLQLSENNCWEFEWYLPVFDVTWSTQPIDTEYNMFNNFTDNSLKVLLSNIPSYFQYIIIFWFILFIIWLIKLFKRKK